MVQNTLFLYLIHIGLIKMRQKSSVVILIMLFALESSAQKHDFIWMFGNSGGVEPNVGVTTLDFREGNPLILPDHKSKKSFYITSNMYSDDSGRLLYYSNGYSIYNRNDKVVKFGSNLTKINVFEGQATNQGALFIPDPAEPHRCYYICDSIASFFNSSFGRSLFNTAKVKYVHLDDRLAAGAGDGIGAGYLLPGQQNDSLEAGHLRACRHANGRDWWILKKKQYSNEWLFWLLDPSGIHYHHSDTAFGNYPVGSVCDSHFSLDGNHFLSMSCPQRDTIVSYYLADFDRCVGRFRNIRVFHSIDFKFSASGAAIFSPDSKYIYMSQDGISMEQTELGPNVFTDRVFLDSIRRNPADHLYYHTFWSGQSGPDGRLYLNTFTLNTSLLHRIRHPNKEGSACGLDIAGMDIQCQVDRCMPTFPNYRLGPVEDSDCDSLGIDPLPWCWWRHDQDSSDHLLFEFTDASAYEVNRWLWDFGDGHQSTEPNPVHQFDSNGVYRVCLIVNNRHGADTLCRTLHIGTLSTDEYAEHSQVNLQTFPQPAHSDLIVNVLDYIPQKMSCTLLDIQGQALLHQRLFGGSNVLNVRSVPAGMYLLKISEINRRDRFEKILIEH